MNKYIIVTNNFKGYHRYAKAPANVQFLQNIHRHVFNVKTTIEVFHNERELEFFCLQDEIERFIRRHYNHKWTTYVEGIYIGSCEALAEALVLYLKETYPGRYVRVEVWEDNENGAIVED